MHQSSFNSAMPLAASAELFTNQNIPYHGYVPPPPPSLNGGLFTGQPFKEGAPWANVPVTPDTDYMTNVNLRSANPPPAALYQYPGNTRPGNNYQANTGLKPYSAVDAGFELPYNFSCIPCELKSVVKGCYCNRAANISGNNFSKCECGSYRYVQV